MKKIKLSTLIVICLSILLVTFSLRPYLEKAFDRLDFLDRHTYLVNFVDDSGSRIKMNSYAKRIISLYSGHTENLFALNLDNEIIGVSKSDNYPLAVLNKNAYDYELNPEKILAASPDLVLITPSIEKESPGFVKTLRRTGINVVSLYPTNFSDFPRYIERLGMLTGKINTSKIFINDFNEQIREIEEITRNIENKVNVYLETSEIEYMTVIPDSLASNAIRIAGGNNIAIEAYQIDDKSSIAEFGEERIMENSEKIDVYLSQRGGVNSGGNVHSIVIRPGFENIKAVKNNRVFTMDEKLIFDPTLRYIKGIKEMCRIFYPDTFDDINIYASKEEITREILAEVCIKYTHKNIFIPSSKYYRSEHKGHVYGFFEDVSLNHERFDFIETAVLAGYMNGDIVEGVEMFYPQQKVTREELAKTVYLLSNISKKETHKDIKDISDIENKKIVQALVDNEIFELENGYIYPQEYVTGKEVVEVLNRLRKNS